MQALSHGVLLLAWGLAAPADVPLAGATAHGPAQEEGQQETPRAAGESPGDAARPTQAIEASEQAVDVSAPTPDEAIARRLRAVLHASRQIDELQIEVVEGIVFLRGRTPDDERREWASNLARRTEGVVAVVNDIALEEAPLWTLEPARETLFDLWRGTIGALPLAALGALILLLAFPLATVASGVAERLVGRRHGSDILRPFVRRIVGLGVMVVGVYIALRVSGLTRLAVTVLGGTSLIGLAFGFAFRDIAENFLAGILLSIRRPFRLGDTIEIAGYVGVVRSVTSHGTLLIDFDGNVIRLSNSAVYKGELRNLTSNPKSRESFVVGIGYDSSIEQAQEILVALLKEHEAVLDDPEPFVLVEALGSSTVRLHVYFWFDVGMYAQLRLRSAIMRQAVGALLEAGISLPDDAREVVFPHPVPLRIMRGEPAAAEGAPAAGARPQPHPAAAEARREREQPHGRGGEGSLASEVPALERQAEESGATEETSADAQPRHRTQERR